MNDLNGKVVIVTGGAGLMGEMFVRTIFENGGIPIAVDIDKTKLAQLKKSIGSHKTDLLYLEADITMKSEWIDIKKRVLKEYSRIDVLINNAAANPKVDQLDDSEICTFEEYPLEKWQREFEISVTGALLGCQVIGRHFAANDGGSIINIGSDLAVIAPDQRIYQIGNQKYEDSYKKPVSYSVNKHSIVGLTKYLATYWLGKNIRVNCLSPGGVYTGQHEEFHQKVKNLIPLGRMANLDDYRGAVLFLCSDSSSYMNGHNLVIDGGRTIW